MPTRLQTANTEDYIKGKLLGNAVDKTEDFSRVFYYGIVINNSDPKNANRIQVRIPIVDDRYYISDPQDLGNTKLPWCMPFNRNFISTPEHNSIVVVAFLDPRLPYFGRMYFDAMTDLNANDIFDYRRLVPEAATLSNWVNAEDHSGINIKSKPPDANAYNTRSNIQYGIGIRGKGKNRFKLTDTSVEIYQNEKDTDKESFLKLTSDVYMEAGTNMDLFSKKGGTKYHPVFDQPLYDYLLTMNEMLKAIIKTMATKPSINSINLTPNLPSPDTLELIAKLQNMYNGFNKLKIPGNGASKYLRIN